MVYIIYFIYKYVHIIQIKHSVALYTLQSLTYANAWLRESSKLKVVQRSYLR